jgi:poly [ADP-ribose] polymerase 2/3/4
MISQPDTTTPYGDTYSGGSLGFNEYVIYDPSHVLIRYLFRVKVKAR